MKRSSADNIAAFLAAGIIVWVMFAAMTVFAVLNYMMAYAWKEMLK